MSKYLVRVCAPHFVAGMIVDGDTVTDAAPILKWTIGKRRDYLSAYFKRKGWAAHIVTPRTPGHSSG